MGIFSDIKAIKEVQKIKNGGKQNLSISQITGLITNMSDAKKNLDEKEFNQVYKLFLELRKCNTKMKMDMEGYCETAVDIINRFDKIAPYEKYSGGNEIEFSFLMDKIHQNNDANKVEKDNLTNEDINYITYMLQNAKGIINMDDATDFIMVLHTYQKYGKDQALEKFDELAQIIIERNIPIKCISKVSFLIGTLNANRIINVNEMNMLSSKYQQKIMQLIMKNSD